LTITPASGWRLAAANTRPVTRGEINGEKGIDVQPTNAKVAKQKEKPFHGGILPLGDVERKAMAGACFTLCRSSQAPVCSGEPHPYRHHRHPICTAIGVFNGAGGVAITA
jgi:hypothetical protein